jgi:hypothetical protein
MSVLFLLIVIEGRELVAMDSTGTSDPYVIVSVGGKEKRTKVIRFTLNPKWRIGSAGEKFKLCVSNNVFLVGNCSTCRLKALEMLFCFSFPFLWSRPQSPTMFFCAFALILLSPSF